MTHSVTAERNGFLEQNTPSDYVIDNLLELYDKVLLPLLDYLPGELSVNCAYRCDRVNVAVGGAKNSQHTKGMAADIEYREDGVEQNNKIVDAVNHLKLEYDQMILEKVGTNGPAWIHLSYNKDHNRKMTFKL